MEQYIEDIRREESYKGQIEHIEIIPPKQARYGELDTSLPNTIQNYLDRHKIRLFSHQASAINAMIDICFFHIV